MWQKSPVMQMGSQLADNSHACKNIQNKIKQQADEKRDWMNADFFIPEGLSQSVLNVL
jgi:hypothetical protein